MIKKKIFKREESPYVPGKWMIRANNEAFHLGYTEGSFNIIQARLFGLSYPDYLRMCRDHFGAILTGKNSKYPYALFDRSKEMDDLIEILNARANLVLWNREHPDYEEHAAVVKEKTPNFYKEVTGNE